MNLIQRIRLAIDAPKIAAERDAAQASLAAARRTIVSVQNGRANARTFAEAAKREGLIPAGAWQRYVNCMTDSESERDIQRDIEAAEALRQRLNRADANLVAVRGQKEPK